MKTYDKLYYLFFLISGKRNNPEITVICLLSFFQMLLLLWILFIVLFVLDRSEYIDYPTLVRDRIEPFRYVVLSGCIPILIVNIVLYSKRSSQVIKRINENLELSNRLKKFRVYLIVIYFTIIIPIFVFGGQLWK
jgi:hypothetical protein